MKNMFESIWLQIVLKTHMNQYTYNFHYNILLQNEVILPPKFQKLWSKIKQKTRCKFQVNPKKPIINCIKDLKEQFPILKARVVTQSADINIENSGVRHREKGLYTTNLKTDYAELPNFFIISEECFILLSDVYCMLIESGRSIDF